MVYFVGAGSGAPDLITVRGMRLLEKADVIIYAGSLVNPQLLSYAGENCRIYNSAKMTLEDVLAVMLEGEEKGQTIVRLHTGDPSVYGAVREQMDVLDQHGIAYESCPGVSACFGAAASLNLEYTLPDVSQSLIITRMAGRTAVPEKESIESFAAHHASMAIYLSTGMLEELCERLIAGGYEKTTPAALIYKATWPEEAAYVCTLETLAAAAREHQITKTALVLIGDVIAHQHYQKSKLYAADFETEYRKVFAPPELAVICFTRAGEEMALSVAEKLPDQRLKLYSKYSGSKDARFIQVTDSLENWTGRQFAHNHTILFIGASGIAVRAIAPFVRDKLSDSPVLVMDEMGRCVIPLLSGHVGGANEWAVLLSERTGAYPVITTATDIHGQFAVDLFAGENQLSIENKDGIAKVSSKILNHEPVTVSADSEYADHAADIIISAGRRYPKDNLIWLTPKEYVIGVGCRRGKSPQELEDFIRETLDEQGIRMTQIMAIASIDIKNEELCMCEWSAKHHIPFRTFSGEMLEKVQGDFQSSSFVRENVGVDNVCERAAVAAAGKNAVLIMGKKAWHGMTLAIAKRKWGE